MRKAWALALLFGSGVLNEVGCTGEMGPEETALVDEGEVAEAELAVCQTTCNQAGGCDTKPPGFPIFPPWTPGASYSIDNGYTSGWHCSSDQYSLDFAMATGTNVYAIAPGRVKATGAWDGSSTGYGNFIMIDHQNGYQSLYAHLSAKPALANSTFVDTQTVIGKSGNSGNTTAHLHLTLYKNAKWQGDATAKAIIPEVIEQCYKAGNAAIACSNLGTAPQVLTKTGYYCGSACTQCILTVRNDLIPHYQNVGGWNTGCGMRDGLVLDWCRPNNDYSACDSIAVNQCNEACTIGSCGNKCTQCILQKRPDVLYNYGLWGWPQDCWNRDNIVYDWCTKLDSAACRQLKRVDCANVCPYVP